MFLKYPYPPFSAGMYLTIEPEGFVFTVNTILFFKGDFERIAVINENSISFFRLPILFTESMNTSLYLPLPKGRIYFVCFIFICAAKVGGFEFYFFSILRVFPTNLFFVAWYYVFY